MKLLLLLAFAASVLFFSGCFGVNLPEQNVRETVSCDLLPVPAEDTSFPDEVEIVPFHSDSPAKYKMLHRNGTRLYVDEYSKWVQTPAAMLTRLFRSAFNPPKMTDHSFRLTANILRFEANDGTMTADLTVKYVLTSQRSTDPLFIRTLALSEKMKTNSPEEFAEAMSRAVLAQLREIKKRIREEAARK